MPRVFTECAFDHSLNAPAAHAARTAFFDRLQIPGTRSGEARAHSSRVGRTPCRMHRDPDGTQRCRRDLQRPCRARGGDWRDDEKGDEAGEEALA